MTFALALVFDLPASILVQRTAVTVEMDTPSERVQAIRMAHNAEIRERAQAAMLQQLETQAAEMSAELAALQAVRDSQVAYADIAWRRDLLPSAGAHCCIPPQVKPCTQHVCYAASVTAGLVRMRL